MNQEKSGFDGRTVLAIVLLIGTWLAWQQYMQSKYGSTTEAAKTETAAPAATNTQTTESTPKPSASSAGAVAAPEASPQTTKEETFLRVEDDVWKFEISSLGMGLKDIELKKFTDRSANVIKIAPNLSPRTFEMTLEGAMSPLHFELSKTSETTITGVAKVGSLEVVRTLTLDSTRYLITSKTTVKGLQAGVSGLNVYMTEKVNEPLSSSFFAPPTEYETLYAEYAGTNIREMLHAPESGVQVPIAETDVTPVAGVKLAALGTHYFTAAILDESAILPVLKADYKRLSEETGYFAQAKLSYQFPAGLDVLEFSQKTFIGPKELNLLGTVDPRMENLLDFWVVGSLARPMLQLLKWLQTYVLNWGVAIIILTLIVRLIVLPLYMMSLKSMKAMQKIQPQVKALQEKYKGDPQQLNMEVMKLWKENKINPVGGCLPMLLQIPVFIALYRVLSQSIELYQAPFMLWIKDLSLKDPYFVLPVIMGVAMYLQQKLMPQTAADPAQQKIMNFMPIIFAALMLTLPSGLTLYILVSTLFGIGQQMYVMKKA